MSSERPPFISRLTSQLLISSTGSPTSNLPSSATSSANTSPNTTTHSHYPFYSASYASSSSDENDEDEDDGNSSDDGGVGNSSSSVLSLPPPVRVYVPPLNFAIVSPGIYRAGFPRPDNYPYLDSLGCKTILYLADQDFKHDTVHWAKKRGIKILHYRVEANKEPFHECSQALMASALSEAVDPQNWPIIIHCNRGRHRAGLLCALIRRLENWSMTMIFEEYKRFFGNDGNGEGKSARVGDYEWIETFDLSAMQMQAKTASGHLLS